jgi:four helix bundle protein
VVPEQSGRTQAFTDVTVWKKAHQWVLATYRFSETFPRHELFGLTSQVRRAAVSIPANFAEGYKKRTPRDKARFFNIAQGSIEECRYYLSLLRTSATGRRRNSRRTSMKSVGCWRPTFGPCRHGRRSPYCILSPVYSLTLSSRHGPFLRDARTSRPSRRWCG